MINPKKAYQYFITSFVLSKRSPLGWHSFDCPFCDYGRQKKKCAVHLEYEFVKCWECGYKDFLLNFVSEVENISYYESRKLIYSYPEADVDVDISLGMVTELSEASIELPTGYTQLLDGVGVLGKRARAYLDSRGFDLEVLDAMGFGYCNKHDKDKLKDYFGYIIIPFKSKGTLQYYIGRDYTGQYLRYKNPSVEDCGVGKTDLVFNEDALRLHSTVYVTEGWADAMTLGRRGCSTQGWSVSTKQKSKMLTSNVKQFIFIPDKGYYREAIELAYDFIDLKQVSVVNLDDVEEGKDVNEIGKHKIMELIKGTEPLTTKRAIEIILK